MRLIKALRSRSTAKSAAYHDQVKQTLREGARRMHEAQKQHGTPVAYVDPTEAAATAQSVFQHEVGRHVDKRGRTVR